MDDPVKWRLVTILFGVLALIFLLRGKPGEWLRGEEGTRGIAAGSSHASAPASPVADGSRRRTKTSIRDAVDPARTHSPERLREFILPDLMIVGRLEDALGQVFAAYRDACSVSGEFPLPLTFRVPPESTEVVRVRLSGKAFDAAVRLLGTLAGMKTSRHETEYRFEPLTDGQTGQQLAEKRLPIPPDFSYALAAMTGLEPRQSMRSYLAALGVTLDPTTKVETAAGGFLTLDTQNEADRARILALVRAMQAVPPTQMKYTATTVEMDVGSTWVPPDVSQMDQAALEAMMRELATQQGASLRVLPSVTARNNHDTEISIIREYPVPREDTSGEMEMRDVGTVLRIQGGQLGFGQILDVDYSDTVAEVDESGRTDIRTMADIVDSGFVGKDGTLFRVEVRSDGSKRLLIVQPQLIDATGRPIE